MCFELVDGQRSRLGLSHAINLARESDLAVGWALAEIKESCRWFNENLAVPTPYNEGSHRCLSWFRDSAHEHIRRMYVLKAALETCGVHVDVLTTRDPGRFVYSDEHQITAIADGVAF